MYDLLACLCFTSSRVVYWDGTCPLETSLGPIDTELEQEHERLTDAQLYAAGKAVRVVVLSDTHNRVVTREHAAMIPDGDILIHCGDFTEDGTVAEIQAFNEWLGFLPHRFRVVIPGNHDLSCDPLSYHENVKQCNRHRRGEHASNAQQRALKAMGAIGGAAKEDKIDAAGWRQVLRDEYLSNATHYVEGQRFALDIPGKGTVQLAAAPHTDVIAFTSMRAFAVSDEAQKIVFDRVFPDDVPKLDILVTHGPPRGVLDTFLGMSIGSTALAEKLARMQSLHNNAPRWHVFGHVHGARGVIQGASLAPASRASPVQVPTTFINAATVVGRNLKLREPPALVFDIAV